MEKRFCLLYTSVRPALIPKIVNDWMVTADNPESVEVVISVDNGDTASLEAAKSVPGVHVLVQKEEPFGCVKGWNQAADYWFSNLKSDIIIAIADDFKPPMKWDSSLLSLSPNEWWKGEYVVKIADGYNRDIFTLSILTRSRFDRYGYLFHYGYPSLFNDTEFGAVARRDGVVIEAEHLLFEHLHPDCGKRPRDMADMKHSSRERWIIGETLFNYRRACNFPVDCGPKAVDSEIKVDEKYGAFILVTKDDFCLEEVCKRLYEDGVKDLFFAIPDEYWSGKPVNENDVQEVDNIISNLKDYGANVYRRQFKVSSYRFGNDDRIKVETRLRNDAVNWIRRSGFQHVLIVDGDELWTIGTFAKLKAYVEKAHPSAVSFPMVPVVGLPGYPVNNAKDRAVVYLDSATNFRECRTPHTSVYELNVSPIFHFTAIRRTMDELITKMREGGHYGDPDYDFENWIANTLPNAKPGLKNVHMYKGYQIWPELRNWAESELEAIPESVHKYLGK